MMHDFEAVSMRRYFMYPIYYSMIHFDMKCTTCMYVTGKSHVTMCEISLKSGMKDISILHATKLDLVQKQNHFSDLQRQAASHC